ncbi:hypothetical protein HPULCUR_007548 [Helicostylum pulchrum]|uniref:Uncharacterized protein n=1 Tax=Helicostylum pulchrum TaxID=562976 RepID=A0ABP9Y675_9FUNG
MLLCLQELVLSSHSVEEVTLPDSKVALVISHLDDYNYRQYFRYGHLIMRLKINSRMDFVHPVFTDKKDKAFKYQYKLSKPKLLALLSQLPSLNELDMIDTSHVRDYVDFLLDANMKHINKINTKYSFVPFDEDTPYYKFRDSISCMTLYYCESSILFNSQQINAFNSLSQFKRLTQLEFYNKHDINLTPLHVQDICPNLKHLKFASDYPIFETVMLHLLDKNSKINLNSIASLSHLELKVPSLLSVFTKYLVDYFLNQLIMITIDILSQGFFSWIDVVGMELALKLMEKVGKVKETFIIFELGERYEVQANDETKMPKYFKLSNAFSDGDFYITRILYDNDFHGPNVDLDLPDKNSSIIGPEIFNGLKFDFESEYRDAIYRCLEYSIISCPELQSFDVKCNTKV